MLDFTIFKKGTVELYTRVASGRTEYKIKSDVGSVTAFQLWGAAIDGLSPVWGIANVKRTNLGEHLSQYYDHRNWFMYERGGTLAGYERFYGPDGPVAKQYGDGRRSYTEPGQLEAIFEADRAAYERTVQWLAEHGYGPGGEPFGYNRSHVR